MKTMFWIGASLLLAAGGVGAQQNAQAPSQGQSQSQSPQVNEQVTVTQKPLTQDQRQQLNAAAVRALNRIADTRFAIRMKNLKVARQDIDDAASSLGQVAELSPTATVRDKIDLARKHIDYQSTDKVQQDLIPVAASIDQISAFVPVADAQRHLSQAKQSLSKGDKKTAKNELKLVGDALLFKEVDLPVIETQAQVSKARNALYSGHPQAADDALKMAENAMPTFESAVVATPPGQPSQQQRMPSSNAPSQPQTQSPPQSQ